MRKAFIMRKVVLSRSKHCLLSGFISSKIIQPLLICGIIDILNGAHLMFGALLKLGCTLEFQTHIRERERAQTHKEEIST